MLRKLGVGLTAVLALVAAVVVPAATSAAAGIGNPLTECQENGYPDATGAVKIEWPSGEIERSGDPADAAVTVQAGDEPGLYEWTSDPAATGVLLKAGSSQSTDDGPYTSGGSGTSGSGYTADGKDLSHITFCYDGGPGTDEVPDGTLTILKFYDADGDGVKDATEAYLSGWQVWVVAPDESVGTFYVTTKVLTVEDGSFGMYVVTESMPNEPGWVASTEVVQSADVQSGDEDEVEFGNYCLTASGGKTLGYWSNKNGQAEITGAWLAALRDLHLVDAKGVAFDPTTTAGLSTFLTKASATNMANMLSAQLAAGTLNVLSGRTSADAFYLPAGMTVGELLVAAEAALAASPVTVAAGAARTAQTQLKDWLDELNNGASVIPSDPCPFTFGDLS